MYYQNNTRCYFEKLFNSQQKNAISRIFPPVPKAEELVGDNFAKRYNPEDFYHVMFFRFRCFQACNPKVHTIYTNLKETHHPDLEPANYSKFFSNSCFMSLQKLFEWMHGQPGEFQYPSFDKKGHDDISLVLDNLFQVYTYVPNLERYLLWYPTYLAKLEAQRVLIFYESTIELKYAYYCSVIIALEAGCPYIAARYANLFMDKEGDQAWLESFENHPPELAPLFPVFRKIVRAPWYLEEDDFKFCKKSGFWNPYKAMHYFLLANYINTICTLSLALGLQIEQPCPFINLQELLKARRDFQEVHYQVNPQSKQKLNEEIKRMFQKDVTKEQLEEIEKKTIDPYMKDIGGQLKTQQIYQQMNTISKILPPHNTFNKNSSEIAPEYFKLEQNYLENVVRQLMDYRDDKVNSFFELSNYSLRMKLTNFGESEEKMSNFRTLIKLYCEKLLGFTKKNIDYRQQLRKNEKFTMGLRYFLKTLVLAPTLIKKQVLNGVCCKSEEQWLESYDLMQLAILATEAKARCNATSLLIYIIQD